jgi:hypothetical protein
MWFTTGRLLYTIAWTLTVVTAPFRWLEERRRTQSSAPLPSQPSDPTWTLRSEREAPVRMKRGVGYCVNLDCEEYAKGVFLLNHGDDFRCPRCLLKGHIQTEKGFVAGDGSLFKEVRVEYNYSSVDGKFHEIAIVRDESLWGNAKTYTLQSPLIKTERRALKVAEAILGNLNRYQTMLDDGGIPHTNEIILSFDEPLKDFSRKLQQLSKEWETSELRERQYKERGRT